MNAHWLYAVTSSDAAASSRDSATRGTGPVVTPSLTAIPPYPRTHSIPPQRV